MKLRIKKIVLGICLALALVVNSGGALMVNAATCWDVRDYGYHRYSQRKYVYDHGNAEYCEYRSPVLIQGTNVTVGWAYTYYYGRLYYHIDVCICGLANTYYVFDKYGERVEFVLNN